MPDRKANSQIKPGRETDFSLFQRLLLLVLNYTSVILLGGVGGLLMVPWTSWGWRLPVSMATLFLLPPLLARLTLILSPIRQGVIMNGSADFFKWWGIFNLQMIFCRLPILEELIRIIPGAYSAWLRLWGARIGRLTYWAAGMTILDRSFIQVGDDVIFGAGVRINPHVMNRNEQGQVQLLLADVVIGHGAIIGGYSLLTTGTIIAPGENTRACLQLPPFTRWQNGHRVKAHDEIPGKGVALPGTGS